MKSYYVIGVMSGTSLDGLDLVYVKFVYNGSWSFKIISSITVSYNISWREILNNLTNYSNDKLIQIDHDYTKFLAENINKFIEDYNIINIDAICTHGHTALHLPDKGLTYQIGNRKELAYLTHHKVVCDFRVHDVALGGQGAPLVPIGDKLLFSEYDFCINIGGFANISLEENNKRIAYDICPANIVLNHYSRTLGFDYDDGGEISSNGIVNGQLLDALNDIVFYKQKHPKSLGLEWVSREVFPLVDSFDISIKDVLRTFVEHIAIQVTNEINNLKNVSVFITGGGVYNKFLINRIKSFTENKILIPSNDIIEFKEAVIFGLLGVLKLRGETNCLMSVTGAKKDHSSGVIFQP